MPLNFNDDRPFLQSALDSAYAQAESRHAQQQELVLESKNLYNPD